MFAVLSNELNTPYILLCPSDRVGRIEASSFSQSATNDPALLPFKPVPFSANANVSYFIGIDAMETNAMMLLAGDRNITNASPTRFAYGVAQVGPLGTNHTAKSGAGWDRNIHEHSGNLVQSDGSVQQTTTSRLRASLRTSGDNNSIAVPD